MAILPTVDDASESASRPGSCRKSPGAVYFQSGEKAQPASKNKECASGVVGPAVQKLDTPARLKHVTDAWLIVFIIAMIIAYFA
jgi:hypothetical protein